MIVADPWKGLDGSRVEVSARWLKPSNLRSSHFNGKTTKAQPRCCNVQGCVAHMWRACSLSLPRIRRAPFTADRPSITPC